MTAATVAHFVVTLSDLLPIPLVPEIESAGQYPAESRSRRHRSNSTTAPIALPGLAAQTVILGMHIRSDQSASWGAVGCKDMAAQQVFILLNR
jgi:hypothetical protein